MAPQVSQHRAPPPPQPCARRRLRDSRPASSPCRPPAYGDDVEAVTTVPGTVVGPNGTAPGAGFVQPAPKPVDDSTTGRGTGLPLALAAVVLVVVLAAIALRARRHRRPGPS